MAALAAVSALLASCAVPSRIDTGMSFSETPLVGKVVWNDLVTDDVEAARRFYGGLLGWSFEETTGPAGRDYGLARSAIGDPDDATTAPGPGRMAWTELLSNDPAASAGFYGNVVGYQPRTVTRRGGEYTLLSSGGIDRAGILANPAEGWSPVWLTSFGVPDAAAAAAKAESLGGKVLVPASPVLREGTMAIIADPAGAILVLQQVGS
jgi:predicted enzyme related to lactoylglutathione lyase